MAAQRIEPDAFAQRLRQTREQKLLTQDDLAGLASVGKVSLSRLENGHTTPRFSTVRRLAAALEVSPQWLAYGDEK